MRLNDDVTKLKLRKMIADPYRTGKIFRSLSVNKLIRDSEVPSQIGSIFKKNLWIAKVKLDIIRIISGHSMDDFFISNDKKLIILFFKK